MHLGRRVDALAVEGRHPRGEPRRAQRDAAATRDLLDVLGEGAGRVVPHVGFRASARMRIAETSSGTAPRGAGLQVGVADAHQDLQLGAAA